VIVPRQQVVPAVPAVVVDPVVPAVVVVPVVPAVVVDPIVPVVVPAVVVDPVVPVVPVVLVISEDPDPLVFHCAPIMLTPIAEGVESSPIRVPRLVSTIENYKYSVGLIAKSS